MFQGKVPSARAFAFAFSGLKGETGATGAQGPQGATGPAGASGTNAYFRIDTASTPGYLTASA